MTKPELLTIIDGYSIGAVTREQLLFSLDQFERGEILRILKGLRDLNEKALAPLIAGYIEIKIDDNRGPIKRISKQ